MLLVERVEHHDLVDAVHELGPELGLHLAQHRELDHLVVVARHLLDHLRAQVRGHHDHRVLEIHGAALPVGHAAVVEHLQQHVEHVRMRLLDLVEQDHRVRLAAHGLRQVAALLVADVSRRRADQPRDRMLLHELGHVDPDEVVFRVEQELGERLAQLGLADAGRAEEQERAVRLASGSPSPARERRIASATSLHRLVLADDALVELLFHLQQLLALALHHLGDRDAGPARDHFGDLLRAHLRAQQPRLAGLRLVGVLQLRLELRQLAVLQLGDLVELALALQLRDLGAHAVDLLLDVRAALHLGLLRLPDLLEVGVLALERA